MPVNRKYPLAALMAALRAYPLPKRRRIFIEYTLVAGKNDELDEARKLAKLLRDVPVKINLHPDERHRGVVPTRFRRWTECTLFQQVLIDEGYTCFVRKRRGDERGCGVRSARAARCEAACPRG